MINLFDKNIFFQRLTYLSELDTQNPFASYCDTNIKYSFDIQNWGNSELERMYDRFVIFFAEDAVLKSLQEILSKERIQDMLLLLRVLPFFPKGIDITVSSRYGLREDHIRHWHNQGLCFVDNNDIVFADPTISLLIYSQYKLMIPVRRLSVPLSLILAEYPISLINKNTQILLELLDTPLAGLGTMIPNSIVELVKKLYDKVSNLGKKALLHLLLIHLYKALRQKSNIEYFFSFYKKKDVRDLLLFQYQSEPSPFLFPHPQDTSLSYSVLPVEAPKQWVMGVAEQFQYPDSFFVFQKAAQKDFEKNIQQKMSDLVSFLRHLLFAIYVFEPEEGEGQPHINYLPVDFKYEVETEYLSWIFNFFTLTGFVEKKNKKWKITQKAIQWDNYSDLQVTQQVLFFFLWHPGLPFLSSMEKIDSRLQEEIKVFFLLVLFMRKGQTIGFSSVTDPSRQGLLWEESSSNDNDSSKETQNIFHPWLQYFGSYQALNDIFLRLARFFAAWGYLWEWEDRVFYISANMFEWNPMGDFLMKLHAKKDSMDSAILDTRQFNEFLLSNVSLQDLIFCHQWAFVKQMGKTSLWAVDQEKIKQNVTEERIQKKIQVFIQNSIKDSNQVNNLQIVQAGAIHERVVFYYQENHVIVVPNQDIWQDIYQNEIFKIAVTRHFHSVEDWAILLLHEEFEQTILSFLKQKEILVFPVKKEPVKSAIQKEDNTFYVYEIFFARLIKYIHRLGPVAVHKNDKKSMEKNILEYSSEDMTDDRLQKIVAQAIDQEWLMEIEYFAKSHDYRSSTRLIVPQKVAKDHLIAFCHLRQDQRMFVFNRIGRVKIIKQ